MREVLLYTQYQLQLREREGGKEGERGRERGKEGEGGREGGKEGERNRGEV